ncbi:MAG TPA: cytochrome P450 [Candidatus Dormibacteraeota bacterium]
MFTRHQTAAEFDLRDRETVADPFPAFRRLREVDPAHWSDHLHGWVLTRYDDVRDALSLSVDRIIPFLEHQGRDALDAFGELRLIALWSSFSDQPMHTHLRRLMGRALTTGYVAAAEAPIRATVDRLLGDLGDRTEIDVMADFASKLPIGVMASLLGLPVSDAEQLRVWSDEVNLFVGGSRARTDRYARAARGVAEMTAYFREVVADRRAAPGHDLVSRLVWATDDGEVLTDDEVVATCVMLTYAGHVTTAHLVGNGVLALIRNPGQLALVREDRSLIPAAVEEMFRYDGPVQAMVRIADRSFELHGRRIARGDRIFPMLNAANRDPAQFDDPEAFDVLRSDNRHIVFGHGIHTCIGLQLARLEIPIAFDALLDRVASLELAAEPAWIDSVAFRGPARLPVAITPAPAGRHAEVGA